MRAGAGAAHAHELRPSPGTLRTRTPPARLAVVRQKRYQLALALHASTSNGRLAYDCT